MQIFLRFIIFYIHTIENKTVSPRTDKFGKAIENVKAPLFSPQPASIRTPIKKTECIFITSTRSVKRSSRISMDGPILFSRVIRENSSTMHGPMNQTDSIRASVSRSGFSYLYSTGEKYDRASIGGEIIRAVQIRHAHLGASLKLPYKRDGRTSRSDQTVSKCHVRSSPQSRFWASCRPRRPPPSTCRKRKMSKSTSPRRISCRKPRW